MCRGEKTRTSDLHVPNVARCQLCYTPIDNCECKCNVFLLKDKKHKVKILFFSQFFISCHKNGLFQQKKSLYN